MISIGYERQNFKDGQVLTAECLNCIEDGICNSISVTEQNLTPDQKTQARKNIGAATVADVLAALPTWNGGSY